MEEPIRVAQVIGKLSGYGITRYVMRFYQAMDRDKIQFDFYVRENSRKMELREEIEKLGGRVYLVPTYWPPGRYVRTLLQPFRQNHYAIVHSHTGVNSVFPLFAAKWAGVPVRIAHNHTSTAKGEKRNALMYMLRPLSGVFATHYAAVSRQVGRWLFGRRAMARGEVTIFNPVIHVQAYRYDEAVRVQVRKEMGLEGRFVIGHVGRFCYQKNHDFLLDIFEAVHARRPDALLMLVGDGETMDAVERKAEALGLRGDVLMLGNRDDVDRLYQAMDVFALPSRYEGLPTVALEAQAAGLKVVTSTCVTAEAKVRDDMVYLDLDAGAESWAREMLRESAGERRYAGDFSAFDVASQARRLERYYLELFHALKADSQ